MIRTVITAIIIMVSGVSNASQIMQMHSLDQKGNHFYAKFSSHELAMVDTDGDGTANWKTDPMFPGTFFPNDEDMDGDGVKNFFDREPYNPNVSEYVVSDIYKYNSSLNKDLLFIDSLQVKFVDYSDKTDPSIVKAIGRIFREGVPRSLLKCFSKVKYILSYKDMGNPFAKGYYLSPVEAIAVPGKNLIKNKIFRKKDELIQTIAHELGHVVAYSCESPQNLRKLAVEIGGWEEPENSVYSFGEDYFQSSKGGGTLNETFPTSYSQHNIHEWYAENFSEFVMARLGKRNQATEEFQKYFSNF